ncbi:unnamed protein product [Leptosia nina]|uniref:Longitudinals lacking protein n=1 Tax=Leptosia nina TaxID=320188 RepID=A0AAV1JPT2_9NEOP
MQRRGGTPRPSGACGAPYSTPIDFYYKNSLLYFLFPHTEIKEGATHTDEAVNSIVNEIEKEGGRDEWLDATMDDDQQFCLRWNNHQSTLVSVFDTLLEKGIHVDCTLAAEGQTLKAHKVVLSACSPYFENVLSQQFDKHPIIILKDVKYAELRAMMDYMYRGEVNISQDQLAALLKAAESLQIKGLSDNKPSRPPSRPTHVSHPPAHPPRVPSPPPQARDGSVDSREGSMSPSRRRKKVRRLSSEPAPPMAVPSAPDQEDMPCKEEVSRDGVEDLTLDEDAGDPPAQHNDVVRNFQWHMERSQDEIMNSNDSVRESQGKIILWYLRPAAFVAALRNINDSHRRSVGSSSTMRFMVYGKGFDRCSLRGEVTAGESLFTILRYAKTPFPLTRGLLKRCRGGTALPAKANRSRNRRRKSGKIRKRRASMKRRGRKAVKLESDDDAEASARKNKSARKRRRRSMKVESEGGEGSQLRHVCSICKKKKYKYRRNRLRHEKYECVKTKQFGCDMCGKKYSQNKTLLCHIAEKHS